MLTVCTQNILLDLQKNNNFCVLNQKDDCKILIVYSFIHFNLYSTNSVIKFKVRGKVILPSNIIQDTVSKNDVLPSSRLFYRKMAVNIHYAASYQKDQVRT